MQQAVFSVDPSLGWDSPRYVPPMVLTGADAGCTSRELTTEREALPYEQLITAARNGDQALVGRLLNRGVTVNTPADFGVTALWQACRKRHQNVAKMLVRAGADPNVTDAVWETTPLWMAEDPKLVQLLVRVMPRENCALPHFPDHTEL